MQTDVEVTRDWRPRILGLGGTTRADSSSERALRLAIGAAERGGALTRVLTAVDLEFPAYAPERRVSNARAARLLESVAACDGLIVASPGFHGGPSGLIKNALDYLEELRGSVRPYLDGRAVGCIVCAAGWQATTTTLVSLRSTLHALRGWPTPLGVAINSAPRSDSSDEPVLEATSQLEILAGQVVQFARWAHEPTADRRDDGSWSQHTAPEAGPATPK
jgi:FMN reductase